MFSSINAYRALRSAGYLKRVLENPLYKDSRVHTLLALPDFSGYITANTLLDTRRNKKRPMLAEWEAQYIAPRMLEQRDLPRVNSAVIGQ